MTRKEIDEKLDDVYIELQRTEKYIKNETTLKDWEKEVIFNLLNTAMSSVDEARSWVKEDA